MAFGKNGRRFAVWIGPEAMRTGFCACITDAEIGCRVAKFASTARRVAKHL